METKKQTLSEESTKDSSIVLFAIRNPYFVIVSCLMVLILGTLSLAMLPKDLLPSANMPAVQILSFYSGMPVEHVEKNLTARFERYTGQAIGIERQESKSLVGVSIVKNFFGSGTDLNTAIAQTTSLVMSVLRRLPPGTQPPLILPFDPMSSVPLALVAVSGDHPEKELYDIARYDVGNAIQAVPGAMAPTVMGGAERQVVVYLDPKKLKQFNFSSLDVINRLNQLNTFVPSGSVKIGLHDYQILSNGIVDQIDEMNEFPLRSENGVSVHVKDVGVAQDANKIQTNIVMVDGKRQVYVPVYRQPGSNSIRVVDEIKETLTKLQKRLGTYGLKLVADQSVFIRHAIESITTETLLGGGLAALLVLFFLGDFRSTGGVLISLPLSFLCAFLGLRATGQTINAMTLGGLALSVGVLVDDSIVVIENISKKIGAGLPVHRAAIEGASEVAMPVLASTLSTLVVFFPVLFLDGIVKVLLSALAKSVIFAMIGAYLVSLTVIPLFSAHILKAGHDEHSKTGAFGAVSRALQKVTDRYQEFLRRALMNRTAVLAAATAIPVVLAAVLVGFIGTELFPRADAGNFVLALRQPSGVRIEETEKFANLIQKKLREWIEPEDLSMIITNAGVAYGFPAAFTPNSGPQDVFFNVELTEHRKYTSQHYAKLIRKKIAAEFPKVETGFELGGLLSSALNGGLRAPINIQIEGSEIGKSHEIAGGLAARIKPLRGAVDVRIQQRLDAPQVVLDVDRKKAGILGLTADEVIKNIVSAVSGSSTFSPSIWVDSRTGIDYLFGVQFPEDQVASFKSLEEIPITGRHQERTVPLRDIASIRKSTSMTEVNHVNLKPVVDIFMDAEDRDIGGLSRDVQKEIDRTKFPEGYSATIRGEISEMKRSVGALGGGFLLAAVLVYLILVIQFRSFLVPTVVMTTVPLGMVGIVVMLAVTGTYFSIQAAIGAIFMIGIAVANGVLLIDFILKQAKTGGKLDDAIVQGATARLRPILMTSLASVLGLVPMALGLGHGSEANIPLGRAVIGGQLFSVALTLFVVPVLFRVVFGNRFEQAQAQGGIGRAPAEESKVA